VYRKVALGARSVDKRILISKVITFCINFHRWLNPFCKPPCKANLIHPVTKMNLSFLIPVLYSGIELSLCLMIHTPHTRYASRLSEMQSGTQLRSFLGTLQCTARPDCKVAFKSFLCSEAYNFF